MTKEQLWQKYVEKNPCFGEPDSRFTITGKGIKSLFDQTWDKATESTEQRADIRDKLRGMFEKSGFGK